MVCTLKSKVLSLVHQKCSSLAHTCTLTTHTHTPTPSPTHMYNTHPYTHTHTHTCTPSLHTCTLTHTHTHSGTTRSPQNGERQGVDYDFVSVEAFKQMEKNGELLESGVYENNYYGTPKPPGDPSSSTSFPAYSRSPASSGYSKEGLLPSDSLSPSTIPQGATGHTAGATGGSVAPPPHIIPKNPGPLPPNWEIAYTENNEKYFIELVLLCVCVSVTEERQACI